MTQEPTQEYPALNCPHFGVCGGCSALETPYHQQVESKRQRVRQLLEPVWGPLDLPMTGMPPKAPRHDRVRALQPVHPHPKGLITGLYERGSHRVVEIEACRLQAQALTTLGTGLLKLLRKHDVSPYREGKGRGLLRALGARFMPGTGELLVGLVMTSAKFPQQDAIVDGIRGLCDGLRDPSGNPLKLVGIVGNRHDASGNSLLGPTTQALWGKPVQWDRVADRESGDLHFQAHFQSFYQSHRHAEALLFRPAMELLGDLSGAVCVDAYGGVGTFTFRMSRAGASEVTLIEANSTATDDAKAGAVRNLSRGVEVQTADMADAELPHRPDVLLLDPPRGGLDERARSRLVEVEPSRILYVSCNPVTLARDLEHLKAGGYGLQAAQLADLFPHTEHVEALTLLERHQIPR